jgi:SEC-C motif/Aspartyl protease
MNAPKFHAFTLKFGGVADRIITEVILYEAFDPNRPPASIPKNIRIPALWDTGATKSVITPKAASLLGLKSVGAAIMNAAGGPRQCNTYVVNFVLPNNVMMPGMHVLECEDGHPFEAIIGMDIITRGDFAITHNQGEMIVSFRVPPMKPIDYVAEHEALNSTPKAGRNELCPCGSGKKYKRCHGS